ncbi:MAG: alpha/beta hydrolase [Thermogemmatispora sp.]|uniref:alpha/beta fold hydrolase n=1 Tax=Thermogemmatispora sp. TaxID=1968838 RepID=UPI0019ED3E6D|nr:alpha/beta hydrolase [Thermogemmatispora sp.]MBE3566645.1 alpha/beta hydrolase [Thermogemmatispora sp.]
MTQSTAQLPRVAGAGERRTIRLIHYNVTYYVYGAEHGTDGALVLLHDVLAGAFSWREVIPSLTSSGRAIYVLDLLGHGLSDHPWPADTSVWGHADYLAMFLEALQLTNVVLVGHGLGGGVAQILATRLSRERVAALVLIDTVCYLHAFAEDWPLPQMKERQEYDAPKRASVEEVLRDLRATLPAASARPEQFKQQMLDDFVNHWNSELHKEVLYQHIRNLIPYYVNSVSSDLSRVGKPVLIIWGEEDQQIPLKYAQRLHREIPGSQLSIIPQAGHLVLFDAPEAVARAIRGFVSSLSARA